MEEVEGITWRTAIEQAKNRVAGKNVNFSIQAKPPVNIPATQKLRNKQQAKELAELDPETRKLAKKLMKEEGLYNDVKFAITEAKIRRKMIGDYDLEDLIINEVKELMKDGRPFPSFESLADYEVGLDWIKMRRSKVYGTPYKAPKLKPQTDYNTAMSMGGVDKIRIPQLMKKLAEVVPADRLNKYKQFIAKHKIGSVFADRKLVVHKAGDRVVKIAQGEFPQGKLSQTSMNRLNKYRKKG